MTIRINKPVDQILASIDDSYALSYLRDEIKRVETSVQQRIDASQEWVGKLTAERDRYRELLTEACGKLRAARKHLHEPNCFDVMWHIDTFLTHLEENGYRGSAAGGGANE